MLEKLLLYRNYTIYRPNIVVKTLDSAPYQEDKWRTIRIGGTILEFSLPDNRCLTVNHNQKTAARWLFQIYKLIYNLCTGTIQY